MTIKTVVKEEGARPIKIWTEDVEASALTQLKNIARLPFIYANGVAAMPDVHAGKGSTIGTVIATDKAIIPAAVGVDIGCFLGETKIPLLDGTQATLRELASRLEPFWVYSIDKDMQPAPGLAKSLMTRRNAELMRVVVSGGDEVICTPDHKFMLYNGSFKEAKDLKFNDSLMPLYRRWQTRDGYESVSNGKRNSKQTHAMVWEHFNNAVPVGHIIHHKNHIHFDNRPENLELMEVGAHSAYHRAVGRTFDNANPVFQGLRLEGVKRRSNNPEKRDKMVAVGVENITRYMKETPEHFAAATSGNGERGAPYLRKFNTTPRSCEECGQESKNPSALRWHKSREHGHNHKVILTEKLEYRADVYCLQVEEHHNFALAAGVFVHNCGMNAVRLNLKLSQLPDSLLEIRNQIERDVPLGKGGENRAPDGDAKHRFVLGKPATLVRIAKYIYNGDTNKTINKAVSQLGSLGSGNHFIEICGDENDDVWVMLHSGSRGIGNMIGNYFIEKAKRRMEQYFITLPDGDLAYLPEDTDDFNDYVEAVGWAQNYAFENRRIMLEVVIAAMRQYIPTQFTITEEAINCHHNYVERENHFGRNLWVTRKGAIRARDGDLGIIPGSMGQRSYIVRGKGNAESYCSCSHGAGRAMSRTAAKTLFTVDDLKKQTLGVECRKDADVIDEIPSAYKNLDEVMSNQTDLVEVVHTLKAVLCVKGN